MSKVKDFLAISRAPLLIGSLANPLLGTALAAGTLTTFLSTPVLVFIVLYYLLIVFACNINSLFDMEVDGKYKRHLSDAAKSFGTRNLKIVLASESIGIAALLIWIFSQGYHLTGTLSILGFLCALAYSAEPLRIKKRGFWSPFPVMIGLYTLPILAGWFLFNTSLPLNFLIFVAGYAFINEGITLINTVEDHPEDEQEGIKTWSHVFGMRNTLILALLFSAMGFGTVASLMLSYPAMSLISIGLVLLSTFTIFIVVLQVGNVSRSDDLGKSAKTHAKKMPKWFMMVRFPLLFSALSLLA